jgi:hypothetical protein
MKAQKVQMVVRKVWKTGEEEQLLEDMLCNG